MQKLNNRRAADEFEALARRLEEQGNHTAAEAAYQSAADIDLQDAELQVSWGGALNGQAVRQRMFEELLDAFAFDAVVETGTFRGTTTEWIAERYSGPILTCEINKRYYLQSRKRLSGLAQVRIEPADSTEFLSRLKGEFPREAQLLFYLDAHWLDRLPLAEELAIIQHGFPRSVAMVDDFEVPLDRGYAFDNYGPGKRVDLNLLAAMRGDASFFLPAISSRDETGAKRGVCVLAWDPAAAATLGRLSTLRGADERDWSAARLTVELEAATAPAGPVAGVANNITVAVEERVKTLAVGIAGAVANAMLSPTVPGKDAEQDDGWGVFLTEIRKAIAPLRSIVVEDRQSIADLRTALSQDRQSIATSLASQTEQTTTAVAGVVTRAVAAQTQQTTAAVEDRMKDLAMGIAGAVANAVLSPTPPGTDRREDEQWGPFLTEIRKALAPLRNTGMEPMLARLDHATATEIALRADLSRTEYRAIAAEKERRQIEERFAMREERRAHEEELLRRVLADLEPQVEHLRSENALLHGLVNEIRSEQVSASDRSRRLQEQVSSIAASRWIKVGTRLGLSKLDRHLNDG